MDNVNERAQINNFRFEDLRVYKKALNYSLWVSENLQSSKNQTQVKLIENFYKSTMAIALNIAEGSSRTQKQFEHYLRIAKTAIRECIVYSTLAYDSKLLTESTYNESRQVLMELTKMVCALIISLQKNQAKKPVTYINEGDSEAVETSETFIEPEIQIQID